MEIIINIVASVDKQPLFKVFPGFDIKLYQISTVNGN